MATKKHIILLNAGKKTLLDFSAGLSDTPVKNFTDSSLFFVADQEVTLRCKDMLVNIDANTIIYNRFTRNAQFTGLILEYAKLSGAKVLNEILTSYKDAPEKIAQMMRVVLKKVPIPKSIITTQSGYRYNSIEILRELSFPLVLKLDGMKGEQVLLIQSEEELNLEVTRVDVKAVFLLQEYIPNEFDIRILYACGNYIGAIKRIGGAAFLNNVSQGAAVEAYDATNDELEIVKNVMLANLSDIAGIDIIHRNSTPLFLELNHGFGVEGYEKIHNDKAAITKIAKIIQSEYC
jgi:glutathione synthase/RimK-type ligase-like ATP-grasp enzyme